MPVRLTAAFLFLLALGSVAFAQPNYSRDISRIYQAKCQICHRDGDVAPFSLNNYDAAVAWAFDSRRAVSTGAMPPWKPVASYGDFRDNYSLTPDEKQAILDWIDNGMNQADPEDRPDRPGSFRYRSNPGWLAFRPGSASNYRGSRHSWPRASTAAWRQYSLRAGNRTPRRPRRR